MEFKLLRGDLGHIWKTATGRETPVKLLTTGHIKNIIRCLMGHGQMEIPENYLGKSNEQWFNIFTTELRNRNVSTTIWDF